MFCNKISCLMLVTLSSMLFSQKHYKHDVNKTFKQYNGNYVIVVLKKKFKLLVFNREGCVASYLVGIGSNQDMKPKLYEGDNRTPEGFYKVEDILSVDASQDSPSYQKLFEKNKGYWSANQGHHKYNRPEVDLGHNAYGPRYYLLNYPNDTDAKRYEEALKVGKVPQVEGKPVTIGSSIAIHGTNDPSSIGHLCSHGCIRMHNDDVLALNQYITLQTPVLIYAK